jgi:hypothetical protein
MLDMHIHTPTLSMHGTLCLSHHSKNGCQVHEHCSVRVTVELLILNQVFSRQKEYHVSSISYFDKIAVVIWLYTVVRC